ncbi:MAG: TOBE domain-containing protein [Actinomycetaceae bacterium]|nr:TOBE domain-containing protein [Actinomycetaceae bacterium]
MPSYRISTIAAVLGVSDDTVRRWLEDGHIVADTQTAGPQRVDGKSVVDYLARRSDLHGEDSDRLNLSIRNNLTGIVTAIKKDHVMSQVDLQCGPFRVVSLISTEAVEELGLEIGSVATAQVKATNVSVKALTGEKQ